MTTSEISKTGIESSLINQPMNEMRPQTRLKTDKGEDHAIGNADTVKIAANILESPIIEFEDIDEEKANILALLAANDLSKYSFGMTTRAGTEALKSFI